MSGGEMGKRGEQRGERETRRGEGRQERSGRGMDTRQTGQLPVSHRSEEEHERDEVGGRVRKISFILGTCEGQESSQTHVLGRKWRFIKYAVSISITDVV